MKLLFSALVLCIDGASAFSGKWQEFNCGSNQMKLSFLSASDAQLAWNDKGSGAKMNGAFWNAKQDVLDNNNALQFGSYGTSDRSASPEELSIAIVQKGSKGIEESTGWVRIWKDKNSHAHLSGSVWRPQCPSGFVALGDYWVRGYEAPTNVVACVTEECTDYAKGMRKIYQDKDSGAQGNIAVWELGTSRIPTPGVISFGIDTMVGVNNFSDEPPATGSLPVMHVLSLDPDQQEKKSPFNPILSGPTKPATYTIDTQVNTVVVPYVAIKDDFYTTQDKIEKTPFYTIERDQLYKLDDFFVNNGAHDVTKKVTTYTGVTTEQSSTFSSETSISVTAESGVSFLGSGGQVSATIATTIGYSSSKGISQMTSETVENTYTIVGGVAWALYAGYDRIKLLRADGTLVRQDLEYEDNSYYVSTFPLTEHEMYAAAKRREL